VAHRAQTIEPLLPALEPGRPTSLSTRLESLDVFRGLTIAAMVLVNNPGDWNAVYEPLTHAEWNGWTIADLVFPFFLFIVGVAIPLSLGTAAVTPSASRASLARILRRAAILFALGLALNAFGGVESLATFRIPGVLQRIAICYFAAAIVFLYTRPPARVATFVAAIAGYWALLVFVPVYGKEPGILDPNHNLAAAIDRRLLGTGHLYRETWDPEGILSTIPAIATTLAGVLTGDWLRARRSPATTSRALVAIGIVAVAASGIMTRWMPINKGLWTSSYVVFTAGLALVLFGGVHWLVDGKGIRRPFLPLVVFGVNPIAVYVFSSAAAVVLDQPVIGGENLRDWFCRVTWARFFSPPATSLAYAATYVLIWLAAMTVLYRRKIYIKI
jgi:predicted acyltransferase